jgi:16S rRNA (guanine(1405)-N(7))-methyltransferase
VSEAGTRKTVERLRAAPKYRQIHIDTITDIVRREAAHATSEADLERRARLKLHKVIAGYLFTARPARTLRGLDEAVAAGPEALREWCRGVLARHFSSAERLPDLDRLYPAILDLAGPAASIADLACALNPFTVPWLRAATAASYTGYDLNLSYVELGGQFLGVADAGATVLHRDVLVAPGEIRADVALLLKTYHCIEGRRPGVRTMSGRPAAFTPAHLDRITELARRRGWEQRRASLAQEELIAVIKRPAGEGTCPA